MMFEEFVQVFIIGLLIFLPVSLIYKKAGFHPAWAALVFLPGFGLLVVFMHLALMPWPNLRDKTEHLP